MTKKRVYKVARDNNLTSKEIMWAFDKIGIEVKSHMSMVGDNEIEKVLDYFKSIGVKSSEAEKTEQESQGEVKQQRQKKSPKKTKPSIKAKPTKKSRSKIAKTKIVQQKISSIKLAKKVTVQELADKLKVSSAEIIKKLMGLGIMTAINQEIDYETAEIVAAEYDVDTFLEDSEKQEEVVEPEDDPELLKPRPPIVTVMGHVDHGKTSLLDAIRNENVAATEAGGITQHIGAYQVQIGDKKITFLDTPGHEAFTTMRARGAQVTDIAVLVVAADDGVMPQTIEAISHAKAAGIPIIVAINKIDKPDANIERVKQKLTEYELVAEIWGGDTIMVPVSATKGEGIENLLEMILLVAEMEELKANPDRKATGVVIEAKLDKGRGPVATVIIQKGTLKVGDSIVAGSSYGKVRAMINDKGQRVKKVKPSSPVEILGLSDVPDAGEIMKAVHDKNVKDLANKIKDQKREEDMKKSSAASLEDLFKQLNDNSLKELKLIVKADVHGSVEAVKQSLDQLGTNEVKINIIHSGVGAITETDVMLASASGAIIIGFNVRPDTNAHREAEAKKVEIRQYRVIYEALDDIKLAMAGLLEPEIKEVVQGRAEVRATFKVPRIGTIAGSYVTDGKVTNNSHLRVIRNGAIVYEGHIDSLKRFKDDVKEVAHGYECGIGIENFNDIKESDIIEAYTYEEIIREL